MKCYYVIEKFVCNLNQISKFRLADPEGLYGHHYLLLTDWWRKYCEREDGKICFLDKVIPQNIVYRIDELNEFANSANPIETKDLYYSLQGFLFKVDMIDFTEFYSHLREDAFDLENEGEVIAHNFISRITGVFEQELQKSKVNQYVIEGDGLTGALPRELIGENLKKLLELFQNIQSRLFELTVHSKMKWVGLRCVLLYANEYKYGKIDGLDALKPSFSGELLIVLSRMEQRLHGIIPSGDEGCIADRFYTFSGIILGLDKKICDICNDEVSDYTVVDEEIDDYIRGVNVHMSCLSKGNRFENNSGFFDV